MLARSPDAVRNLFGQFGKIISVTLLKDQAGRSRGFGFLAFETSEAASAAMAKGTLQLGTAQVMAMPQPRHELQP